MRTATLVLGCIGGALLIVVGVPLTVAHPYGLLFLLAGGLAIAGGVKVRGGLLCTATAFALVPSVVGVAAGVGPAVTFLFLVPTVLLLLATIFAFVGPGQRTAYTP